MKKNNLFTLAFAACALLLGACSTELDTSDNPNRAGDNEALVAVSLQFPQGNTPTGYAPGDLGDDVLPGVALSTEKEIRSIAFIAFTKGGTSVYLSKNPTLTDNGFTKPLTPKDAAIPGEYTAQFKIKSADFDGTTTIVAVANYFEHDLTFDGQTLTLDGLKKMLSDELLNEVDKNFIDYPLLMTVAHEEEIVEGSTVPIDFVMERIMARVDVVNNAYDQTTPGNNFVLTSAQLISAPTQGTMIASQNVAPSGYIDLLVHDGVNEVAPADGQPVIPTNPAKQQLKPMYVYENSNTDKTDATKLSATATYVLVKGTYKEKAYEKKIEFRTQKKNVGGTIEGGVIVPIVRNTRYVVEINSSTEGEPVFDVKVTDWSEGEQLDVELEFAEPVLGGIDGIAPVNGATWDAATKTLNITAATGTTDIEFVVRGFQDTDLRMETDYDANAAPLAKTITVERGLLSGYADGAANEEAPLSRTYKVTVPPYTEACPSNIKIIVYNTAYPDAQTEIMVKYAPLFVGDIKSLGAANITSSAPINPSATLVDLKNVANGQSGTVSFFASASAELTTTFANKGLTTDFYTMTAADETELAITKKYGPGKRVTVSYKALTNIPEWAEVNVNEKDADASTAKKFFVKCLKKTYFESATLPPNTDNTLVDGKQLYLAVNNADHGTIEYTVYDDESNTITLAPTATYSGTATSTWIQGVTKSSDEIAETYSDFQIVKRTVKVTLPKAIKAPAQATNFKVGANTRADATLTLTPVYLSGAKITTADKDFRPVLVKSVWWSPINIGQTKISTLNNPSSEGGNIFQLGRKQPLTWDSPKVVGPVASAEAAGTNLITANGAPHDWISPQNGRLWNNGTEANPVKTDNDPCPVGWRVPSELEWQNSICGTQAWTAATSPSVSQNGLLTVAGLSGNSLFFAAAGRTTDTGGMYGQGTQGAYWTSRLLATRARLAYFSGDAVIVDNNGPACAMPVRCVQD